MTKSYDKLDINVGIVLDLPHFEGAGLAVHDVSRYHQECALTHAPVWTQLASGIWVLAYDGANDYLQCPAAESTALNFTTEDFTLLAWVYAGPTAGAADMIMCQSQIDVCGWEFYAFHDTLSLNLRTNQAGSHTGIGAAGCYTRSQWFLAGVTRKGATGQFYVNGNPVTTLGGGGLLGPVSAAGTQRLLIGRQWVASNYWEGMIGRVRAWARDIGGPDMMSIWDQEHALYGV